MRSTLERQHFVISSGAAVTGQIAVSSKTSEEDTARRLEAFFVRRFDRSDLQVRPITVPVALHSDVLN